MSNLLFDNLGEFFAADSRLWAVRRVSSGDVLVGGQIGCVDDDRTCWIESNALFPHRESLFWGYWASVGAPLRACASKLSIESATTYEGADEVARVPSGQTLRARCQLRFGEVFKGGASITWEYRLADCATGQTIATGTLIPARAFDAANDIVTVDLPALVDDQNALLHVWIRGGRARSYTRDAMPPDYKAVTGRDAVPASGHWRHADGTEYQIDTEWLIGALPYDPTQPDQKRILDEIAARRAAGTIKKNPAWALALTTFYPDGSKSKARGEYSCLKIVAGAGDWIGDANVHPNATMGTCLWHSIDGALVPQRSPDPRIRSIGAIEEIDGVLWLGGHLSGRDGPVPFVCRADALGTGETLTTTFICECALLSSMRVNGIKSVGDNLLAQTNCDLFLIEENSGALRMTPSHPGGRGLNAAGAGARQLPVRVVESDFVANAVLGVGVASALRGLPHEFGGAPEVLRPVAHLVDSSASRWLGDVWTIEEDTKGPKTTATEALLEQADNVQYLVRVGLQKWERLHSWLVADGGDFGPLSACGENLLAFGHAGPNKAPVAMRYGRDGKRGISTPYPVLFCEPSLSADSTRQNTLGLFCDDSGPILNWIVFETTGRVEGETGTGLGNSGPGNSPDDDGDKPNARDVFDALPTGARVYVQGLTTAAYPLSGVVVGEGWLSEQLAALGRRNCLWLRVDPATPLPEGELPATPAQLAQLETFATRARFGRATWLPREAQTLVEWCVVIPAEVEWVHPGCEAVF